MSVRTILSIGHPVLREVTPDVPVDDSTAWPCSHSSTISSTRCATPTVRGSRPRRWASGARRGDGGDQQSSLSVQAADPARRSQSIRSSSRSTTRSWRSTRDACPCRCVATCSATSTSASAISTVTASSTTRSTRSHRGHLAARVRPPRRGAVHRPCCRSVDARHLGRVRQVPARRVRRTDHRVRRASRLVTNYWCEFALIDGRGAVGCDRGRRRAIRRSGRRRRAVTGLDPSRRAHDAWPRERPQPRVPSGTAISDPSRSWHVLDMA